MDSEVWGPGAWLFLHSVTMTYPEKPGEMEKQFYKNFFANLGNVLPCPKCKEHYNKNLAESPIEGHLNSRRSLVEWLIEMHNKVNIKNGKPTMTYDQVMQMYYKKYYQKDHIDDWVKHHESWFSKEKIILYVIIFILLVVILIKYHKAIGEFFKRAGRSGRKSSYY
jgi:hypothetical protein